MIKYPEVRVVTQQGCRISYWGLLLLGVIACFFVPCSYRILRVSMYLSYEQRTTRTPLTWSLHISTSPHLHLRSLHLKSINQHIGLGSSTNTIITVAFVCLKEYIYIGCVLIGSSESESTSVHQLRVDTRHVPSHI